MATLFFNQKVGRLSDGDLVMIDPDFHDEGLGAFLRAAMDDGIFPGKGYKVQWRDTKGYYNCILEGEYGRSYILIPLIDNSCARYFKRCKASCFDRGRFCRDNIPKRGSL